MNMCIFMHLYIMYKRYYFFALIDNCQILIETLSLPPVLSPSLFAHCSIVHCNSLLTCQDLTLTWLQNGSVKHDLSVSGYIYRL